MQRTLDIIDKAVYFPKTYFQVNVFGFLNIVSHAAELMAENKLSNSGCRGVVINTSSFSAYESQFGQV